LNVKRVVTGPFQENSFIAWLDDLSSCLIIDPGDDLQKIIDCIRKRNLEPIAVVNTHAHLDHIGAIAGLKKEFGISFYLHPNEKPVLDGYARDCNSILSSISAAEWMLYPHSYEDKIQCLSHLFFNII